MNKIINKILINSYIAFQWLPRGNGAHLWQKCFVGIRQPVFKL